MPENLQTELNAIPGAKGLTLRPDGMWIDAPVLDVVGMARVMQQLEARLSTISAVALGNGETRLIYHYAIKNQAANISTTTTGNSIASLTVVTPAAGWIEREIHDLYSVEFVGHPNLERLVLPVQLANGLFREPGGAAGKSARLHPETE